MSRRRRFREHLPFTPGPDPYFRWRGKEVSRIEGLADGVFGFAVALLIVAAEVPRTFDGLVRVLTGFPAFVATFACLMLWWNAHYRYFRRYGLEDRFSRIVTMGILLLVLFSVYPLKFLFGAALSFGNPDAPRIESWPQLQAIYLFYGLGFIGVWTLYLVLYLHAWKRRHVLELTPGECLQTRETLTSLGINIAVCILSIVLSRFPLSVSLPGEVYALLGPLLTANGYWHGRRVRALARAGTPRPAAQ